MRNQGGRGDHTGPIDYSYDNDALQNEEPQSDEYQSNGEEYQQSWESSEDDTDEIFLYDKIDSEESEVEESEDADEYVLPDSDSRYLNMKDLEGLGADECRIARNELYARHG